MSDIDIGTLLDSSLPQPKPSSRSGSLGQSVDGVLGVLEGLKTPMAQEFGRSMIESIMRKIVPGFSIDDIEQRDLRKKQAELLELRTMREMKDMQVRHVIGQIVDNADTPLQALGGRSLADSIGGIDRGIVNDPDKLMEAAKLAFAATGDPTFDLKMSDLLFSGVEGVGTEAREDPAKQEAERAATDATRIRSEEKIAKFNAEAAADVKTNPLVAYMDAQRAAAEEASGLDLEPSGPLGNDDFDEELGARRVGTYILGAGKELGNDAMITALTTMPEGKRIADALNRAPQNDAKLLTRFEMGGMNGLEKGAVDAYLVLLNEVSKRTGMQLNHLLASMGVDFAGIDAASLQEAQANIFNTE